MLLIMKVSKHNMAPVFPALFLLHMGEGCAAHRSVVCTVAKETSVCYGQPCFLFMFGIVHLERSKVGSWTFQQENLETGM